MDMALAPEWCKGASCTPCQGSAPHIVVQEGRAGVASVGIYVRLVWGKEEDLSVMSTNLILIT